jgi:hypothetical protein
MRMVMLAGTLWPVPTVPSSIWDLNLIGRLRYYEATVATQRAARVSTRILPVVAPLGTAAVISVSEFTVNVAAVPSKLTGLTRAWHEKMERPRPRVGYFLIKRKSWHDAPVSLLNCQDNCVDGPSSRRANSGTDRLTGSGPHTERLRGRYIPSFAKRFNYGMSAWL